MAECTREQARVVGGGWRGGPRTLRLHTHAATARRLWTVCRAPSQTETAPAPPAPITCMSRHRATVPCHADRLETLHLLGRVYAVYGGVFIGLSFAWGYFFDGVVPDRGDIVGSLVAFLGVAIVLFWPRDEQAAAHGQQAALV